MTAKAPVIAERAAQTELSWRRSTRPLAWLAGNDDCVCSTSSVRGNVSDTTDRFTVARRSAASALSGADLAERGATIGN